MSRLGLRRLLVHDEGSAIVEFIFTATLVLIPLIYLVLTAGRIQAASYASVGASDQASKVYVVSESPAAAEAQAREAAARTLRDYGFTSKSSSTSIICGGGCLSPGSTVQVTVQITVNLPFLPRAFDPGVVSVDAVATQRVDRFG